MKPVIICGGWGTKMWPVSREHKPKHFINLFDNKSLFQHNYEALRTKFKPEEIYVSTNVDQVSLAKEQAPEIPDENYILEPDMRNQGPATGLIAAFLLAISPYGIQFSRYNHEANFALFFFLLGLTLFFLGIEKKNIALSFAFLSF